MGGLLTAFAGAQINNNCTISSVLTVGTISPPISGNLTLNGYGGAKMVLGTNSVAVTGNVTMPGYMFAAGLLGATAGMTTATGQVV